jgi:hypothetical protein
MIPKSGYRFSGRIMLKQNEHDPEMCMPVSRLREALAPRGRGLDASAGEGRSEKDHAQE